MKTKSQYIAQAKLENPKPLFMTSHGRQIELTDEEYETTMEAWAEMQIKQDVAKADLEQKLAFKESAKTKLAALGLTDSEINALIGNM